MSGEMVARARELRELGFAVVPVVFKTRKCVVPGWQKLRIANEELVEYFGKRCNVGVLPGEPSGRLVDVDLDCPEAVELAPSILPPTEMRWGRESKRCSHWIYRVSMPVKTRQWKHGKRMVVELRSTGAQTVAPGSIHPSGEPVEFDDRSEPAEIDPATLEAAIERLYEAVLHRRASGSRDGVSREAREAREARDPTCGTNDSGTRAGKPMNPDEVVDWCVVREPGQRDAQSFALARGLCLNAGIRSLEDARPHFERWYRESDASHMRSHDEAWEDFVRGFTAPPRVPLGSDPVSEAFEQAQTMPTPVWAEHYESPEKRWLCKALVCLAERGEFWLSRSQVARALFGESDDPEQWERRRARAGKMLYSLEKERRLICTKRGIPGGAGNPANRYRLRA